MWKKNTGNGMKILKKAFLYNQYQQIRLYGAEL